MLRSLLFGKKSQSFTNKSTNKLSAVGVVEELFEEGSAMLAERYIFQWPLPNIIWLCYHHCYKFCYYEIVHREGYWLLLFQILVFFESGITRIYNIPLAEGWISQVYPRDNKNLLNRWPRLNFLPLYAFNTLLNRHCLLNLGQIISA